MKRHLSVKFIPGMETGRVLTQVQSQTHVFNEFDPDSAFASELRSVGFPFFDGGDLSPFFVRGKQTPRDREIVEMSLSAATRFALAIVRYNEYYAEPKRPQVIDFRGPVTIQ